MVVRPYPTRFVNLDAARAQFGDRVDRLGAYLWRGDDAADAAIDALAALGPARGSALVDEALNGRQLDVPPLQSLVASASTVPAWLEWDRVERGASVLLRAGPLGGIVLGAKALIFGYSAPAGNKPLALSGRLQEMAGRRLNETARFVQAVSRRGGMRPGSDGFKITLKVRLMHAQVRRMILDARHERMAWRAQDWGLPVNQHDMVATTLLFSSVTIEGLRQFGMHIDPDEADDYMHLWRWVGTVIGVEPSLLPATEREGAELARLIYATQGPPDEDSRQLTDALLRSGERDGKPADRARARRMRPVAIGLCRALIGDELADQLHLPRTAYRFALPALRRAVATVELARRRSPRLTRRFEAAGLRYWDAVLANGLGGATAEFALPERLRSTMGSTTRSTAGSTTE